MLSTISLLLLDFEERTPYESNLKIIELTNVMCKHELEKNCIDMNSITRTEYETSERIPKCCSLLITDVARSN